MIVPAREAHRGKTRRRLTLDLFTHHGTFWASISELRKLWKVTASVAVPPEPPFSAESVGVLTWLQMPERFHMPDWDPEPLSAEYIEKCRRLAEEYAEIEEWERQLAVMREMHPRNQVRRFLYELKLVWRAEIPDDIRSGTNVDGWGSWTPFLSACILYDPPPDRLLAFADHDDHDATALPQATYWRDPETFAHARTAQVAQIMENKRGTNERVIELLRGSYRRSDNAPCPSGTRGRPPDDLKDVECALAHRAGLDMVTIGIRYEWDIRAYNDPYGIPRDRCRTAEVAVKRGEKILDGRAFGKELLE